MANRPHIYNCVIMFTRNMDNVITLQAIQNLIFIGYPTTRVAVQANVPGTRFVNTVRGRKGVGCFPGQL